MQLEALKLLWDIQQAGKAVQSFLNGKTLEDYEKELILRSAVERQLFIVGEAMGQLHKWDQELADSFEDRRSIIAFRNRLAHGYAELNSERVFAIATHDLNLLLEKVSELLND